MGEGRGDRVGMIATLASLPSHPESVPINLLVRVEGTPLAREAPPRSLRISAHHCRRPHRHAGVGGAPLGRPGGHERGSPGAVLHRRRQFDLLRARLLTTPNPDRGHDLALLDKLGLVPMR